MNKVVAGYRATRAAMLASALMDLKDNADGDAVEVIEDTVVFLNETMEHYTQIKTGEVRA